MNKWLLIGLIVLGGYQGWDYYLKRDRIQSEYISNDWYSGARGYQQALVESERTGAPVLVYFYADWCRFCKKLDREYFDQAEFSTHLLPVIKVRVNPERSQANRELAVQYQVPGYPLLFAKYLQVSAPQYIRTEYTEQGFNVTVGQSAVLMKGEDLYQAINYAAPDPLRNWVAQWL